MAFGAQCSKCGFTNQPGFQFCTNCGSTLGASPPMPATPPAFGAPPAYGTLPMYGPPTAPIPYAYGPPPWEMERRKQIDRTKTGILLLLVGTLIGWIPLIGGLIGGILLLIGAILVILGRKAFGRVHARNVVLSIVLFIVGIIGLVGVGIVFGLGLLVGAQTGDSAAIASAFNTLLFGAVAVGVIMGLASVFFTYALQNPLGRMLLWTGYGASIAVEVAVLLLVGPLISQAVADAFGGGFYNPAPILALQGLSETYEILNVIPAVIFGAANYIAWSRINRGEIPPPAQPPAPLFGQPPGGAAPPGGTMPPGGGQAPPVHPQ